MNLKDKLRSQIGDDVQHIFDHEALFKLALDRIESLEDALQEASDHLNYCGYGDAWESECAYQPGGTADKIAAALQDA